MLEIGQITEVEIMDLNHTGQGVAKVDNFVVCIDEKGPAYGYVSVDGTL